MNKKAGHHHISMITKKGQQNNQIYQKLLGLRRT
jgi:glyoxalase family protein